MQRVVFFLLCLHLISSKYAPFSTLPPDPLYRPHATHPQKPTSLFGDLKGPYPTNSWWQNLVLQSGDNPVNVLPYIIQAKTNEISFCGETQRVETPTYLFTTVLREWAFTCSEGLISHNIKGYDEISVTLAYKTGSGVLEVPLVQGNPMVTFKVSSSTPQLATINAIISTTFNGKTIQTGTTDSSDTFLFTLNNGHTWVLYLDQQVQLQVGVSLITFLKTYTGIIRMALIPGSDAKVLDQYKGKYPIGVDVDYSVSGDKAQLVHNWKTEGSGDLLMMALPHHTQVLSNATYQQKISFMSMKGNMTGVIGDSWTFNLDLMSNTFDMKNEIDSTKVEAVKAALEKDYTFVINTTEVYDPYFFGTAIGKTATLAIIADKLGETDKAVTIRQNLLNLLEPWLAGKNSDYLQYDETWGGICSKNGLLDQGADFGQGYYNDHHFHYGYHLYALAVLGRYDNTFLLKYENQILDLVRDYANPSTTDPYFTMSRNKDWFTWHSWAAGLYVFADSRNQESTSEALNAYYGVMLMGVALKNDNIMNYGRILLAMELISTKTYWHIPSISTIYPDIFKVNKMVGVLWATKIDYATFFGSSPIFIHGIQMLPFTPVTEDSLDYAFIKEEFEVIRGVDGDDWNPYKAMDQAIVEKEQAWTVAQGLVKYHIGNSMTNTLYWIATRPGSTAVA